LFERKSLSPEERLSLLARPRTAGAIAEGAIVCSCFGVRRDHLIAAIRDSLTTPASDRREAARWD
jgi:NAD(P)H-nitrite reductase large subunit